MTEPEPFTIDLTDEERELMVRTLNEYRGSAKNAYQLLCPVVGVSDKDEWFQLVARLLRAIKGDQPLSDLDWARAFFLTEISFGSNLVGSGLVFGRSADAYWLEVLRSLQYKVCMNDWRSLLLHNAGYPTVE